MCIEVYTQIWRQLEMRATVAQKNMSKIHASVLSRFPVLRGEPPQKGATLKPAEIQQPIVFI